MSTVKANSIYDLNGGSGAVLYGVASPPNSMGFRNRIINGDMRVDSRNVGAAQNAINNSTYMVDRWGYYATQAGKFNAQQNAGSVTPPAGFSNYLGMTVASAVTVGASDRFGIFQAIEGYNMSDFGWGTANAQTVTLGIRVYSSVTGTHSGSVTNYAVTRSYPFTFNVPVANTWTTFFIVIPGDTGGTWVGASSAGALYLNFNLGAGSSLSGTAGAWASAAYWGVTGAVSVVGTAGATFYITGVQLEAGSFPNGTQFERLEYGRQLAQCQRYFEKSFSQDTAPAHNTGGLPVIPTGGSLGCGGNAYFIVQMKVTKRTDGYTVRWYDPLAAHPSTENWLRAITACNSGSAVGPSSSLQLNSNTSNHFGGYAQVGTDVPPIFYWTVDAEL